MDRLLGRDRPADLAAIAALFAGFVLLDRTTRLLGAVTAADTRRFSLVGAAFANRWWLVAALGIPAGALAVVGKARIVARWSELDHGSALRFLAVVLVLPLAWHASLYPYNWLAGRAHLADRALVVVLAAAVVARPAAIVPFVVVVRVINEQFAVPFGSTMAKNIDELPLMALLVIAASFGLWVVVRSVRSSPALLLMGSLVAGHFFVSGRTKLGIGWLSTDVANLPLASHTAGWLGQTGGAWSRALASAYGTLRVPLLIATLVLELGSLVALTHPRLLRIWLAGWAGFHVMVFATAGYWFGWWVAFDVALLVTLGRASLRGWVSENATPARAAVAVAAVLASPLLFHPPRLAWVDAPISYGYRLEATGADGTIANVGFSTLAPFGQDLAFGRLQLGETSPASGPYGALGTSGTLADLDSITTFDELAAYERTLPPPAAPDAAEAFLVAFVNDTNRGPHRGPWSWLSPPEHFWTGVDAPRHRRGQPIRQLDVYLLRRIRHGNSTDEQRELVLRIQVDETGQAAVTRG